MSSVCFTRAVLINLEVTPAETQQHIYCSSTSYQEDLYYIFFLASTYR